MAGRLAGIPGWARALLIGSLALNLGVLGLFGGAVIGASTEAAPPREPFLLRIAPPDRHEEARALLAEIEVERGGGSDAQTRAQAEMLAALRAETFDPGRLEAAFKEWNEGSLARRQATQRQIVRLAATLDPDGRAEMARRLEEVIELRRQRRAAREAAAR